MFALRLFSNLPFETALIIFIAFVATIVIAIAVHEYSHALLAYRLGDPTAKLAGRLTLNPAAHLDPIGTIALLFVGLGWGKPTPFDPFNLKNPKRDSAIIAVSGAVSNFLMAGVVSLLYLLINRLIHLELPLALSAFIQIFVQINLLLGIFNLLPIHPLDGFKVLGGLLPKDWYYDWIQMERYGLFILIILIFTGLIGRIIFPITSTLMNLLLPGASLFI